MASPVSVARSELERHFPGAIDSGLLFVGGWRDATAVASGARFVDVYRHREWLYVRTGDSAIVVRAPDGGSAWELPIRIATVTDAGGVATTLRPVVEVEGGGLRYRAREQLFAGSIRVGVVDERNPQETRDLEEPIQILMIAEADSIVPASLVIDHTNLPFETVRILATDPGDSVLVRIRPDFDPGGTEIAVPVVRPPLILRVSPRAIQGYGLETAVVMVLVSRPDTVIVALTSDRGSLDPGHVAVARRSPGEAKLRSSGRGVATVSAESPPLLGAVEVQVAYVFPWAFLMAALLGGLVGGFLRDTSAAVSHRRRPSLLPFLGNTLTGTLTGILAAAAWAVGINLVNVSSKASTGEAVVAVIAALGAAAGPQIVTGTAHAARATASLLHIVPRHGAGGK